MKKLLLLALILVASCKSEPKTETEIDEPVETEAPKEFVVNMSFTTDKADDFKLMMNNVQIDEFQIKNIHVIEKVQPTSSVDNLTATFDAGNISTVFRIGLGVKEEKEVTIESLDITYGKNSINVGIGELTNYFTGNKFVEIDSASNTIYVKRVDGKLNPTLSLKRRYLNTLIPKE